ncbi:hypothetical protein [Undibacterium crateris]|uniref:hypothetical protein n=1 Tax=Undibacterium crateris TaxID=2528175 RepID=UPI00138942A0|nr:hypothetical protein [Undibacterium crateris]NDI85492.1 hypothetical protein [Undibacterium crateris]
MSQRCALSSPAPDVMAGMALKQGVNANLLRKWVVGYQLACDAAALPLLPITDDADAFVPVILTRGTATPVNQHRDIPMRTTVQKAAPVPPPPHYGHNCPTASRSISTVPIGTPYGCLR